MTHDRLPAILQAMQDAAHEAHDLVLAAGIAHAVDLAELAPLLPLTAGDGFHGEDLYAWASGTKERPADLSSSPWCHRAAARLASTACLLLAVDAKGHEETAMRLWAAAGHLIGIRPTDEESETDAREMSQLQWERDDARIALRTEREQHEATKRERDEALARLAHVRAASGPGPSTIPGDDALDKKLGGMTLAEQRAYIAAGAKAAEAAVAERKPKPTPQVGDIIDAKDVPPGTLVDRQTPEGPLLTIRHPSGRGYHLVPEDEPCAPWPWDERGPVRVLATDISGAEADRVAMMCPSDARAWLADRVRRQPA